MKNFDPKRINKEAILHQFHISWMQSRVLNEDSPRRIDKTKYKSRRIYQVIRRKHKDSPDHSPDKYQEEI